MKVADVMTKDVQLTNPDQTIREAARTMSDEDVGVLPVGENDRLVGMVTDRDIVVRGIAEGKGLDAQVREVMTDRVRYVFDDEDLDQVWKNMATLQVRRLPVMSRDKRLVGAVSLGDLAKTSQTRGNAAVKPHGPQGEPAVRAERMITDLTETLKSVIMTE